MTTVYLIEWGSGVRQNVTFCGVSLAKMAAVSGVVFQKASVILPSCLLLGSVDGDADP